MERITVVIEGATEPVHLDMALAGGRVVSASLGDALEHVEPTDLSARQLEAGLMALARNIGPICMTQVLEAIQSAKS